MIRRTEYKKDQTVGKFHRIKERKVIALYKRWYCYKMVTLGKLVKLNATAIGHHKGEIQSTRYRYTMGAELIAV